LCGEMVRRLASLRIPALRFPGGTISNNYHWRYGTGPVHLRPSMPPRCSRPRCATISAWMSTWTCVRLRRSLPN
jgi:hypothetical protein